MVGSAGTIKVEIHVDDRGTVTVKRFESEVEKTGRKGERAFRRTGRSIGDMNKRLAITNTAMLKLSGLITTLAGAYGFFKLISMINETRKAASDLQEATNKFNVVFAGQVDLASKWASELRESYAMSRRETRQYLSSVQDLLVPMGMMRDEAGRLSFEIVKLSADLGSFNNLPTAMVMADIQSALVGNFETMKKYGVVLNATIVQEKALALGLAETKDQLTAAHKAQAAYKLMVEGSRAAIGDMARTYDDHANQMKQLERNIEDLSAAFGEKLLPMITSAIKKFNELADALGIGNEELMNPLVQQRERLERELHKYERTAEILSWIPGIETPEAVKRQIELAKLRLDMINEAIEQYQKEKAARKAKDGGKPTPAGAAGAGENLIQKLRKEAYAEDFQRLQAVMDAQDRYIQEGLEDLEEINKKSKEVFDDDMKNAVTGWANNFSHELTNMVWEADISFKKILESFGRMVTQMAMQKMIVDPMLGWYFGKGSAHGNIFDRGRLLPFGHGAVINHPMVFPMANGAVGLMAEKGPEAIMPLKRTPSGDLGVKAEPAAVEVNIFNNASGTEVKTQERVSAQGGRAIDVIIDEIVAAKVGRGYTHNALKQVFGMQPRVMGR